MGPAPSRSGEGGWVREARPKLGVVAYLRAARRYAATIARRTHEITSNFCQGERDGDHGRAEECQRDPAMVGADWGDDVVGVAGAELVVGVEGAEASGPRR